MSDKQNKDPSEANAELEREIRRGRQFSLAEAIGRLAGPGMLKGESPIAPQQQAEAEIENYLKENLIDAGGVFTGVILRNVNGSEHLLKSFDQPLATLASYIQEVLNSEYLLKELVREADMEWGRVVGERPYFDKAGIPPHPDDPYTIESVRDKLTRLVDKLTKGDG